MANQGNAQAQSILGSLYAHGESMPQNYATAVMWYQKAANQGYARAQNLLGDLYEKSLGMPQNI